jgi:hypothetical protein
MKDYATIANTLGTFPNVTGKDASGGGAVDGTPYIRQFIDDLWGVSQALMDQAGLTPDGVTESATASQRMAAYRNILGHPGEVIAWMGDAADPSASGIRLLPLTGQGILRTSYPLLDTATYVGDSDNPTASAFYHADDAAGTIRNTTGIYLILPDLRGYFLRGLDTSGTVDPQGATRDIGDTQDDDIEEHKHYVADKTASYPLRYFTLLQGTGVTHSIYELGSGATSLTEAYAVDIFDPVGDHDETRAKNSACRWCIRY